MSRITELMDASLYPSHLKNWDDILFRERILSYLNAEPSMSILDLGAGAGIVKQMNFKGITQRVCGVDPDPRVVNNPYLDEGKVGFGESIPYAANTFDLVFADNVFEHLTQPEIVLGEIFRVLKGNGILLVKTPNKYHYMPAVSRITPLIFHQWINRLRGRDSKDTFPTCYLINTPRDVIRFSTSAGFAVSNIELIEGRPEYLRFSVVTYIFGWLYEKLVNSTTLLSRFRILLVADLRKI
jgi:SAM-dependent methyltransferase